MVLLLLPMLNPTAYAVAKSSRGTKNRIPRGARRNKVESRGTAVEHSCDGRFVPALCFPFARKIRAAGCCSRVSSDLYVGIAFPRGKFHASGRLRLSR